MARLEFVRFQPWIATLVDDHLNWELDQVRKQIDLLPQIFWNDGKGWAAANLWALEKSVQYNTQPTTVLSLLRHLLAYANYLESAALDWRHFPTRLDERVLNKFRGHLIGQIRTGDLASSTANARMSAVIQFYRYAHSKDFVQPQEPMWVEKSIVVPWFDCAGFKRTINRVSTDLRIPNRSRPGTKLEDGLIPLSSEAMTKLLQFASRQSSQELLLILSLGFFTGARLGTILSLRRCNLESARADPHAAGFFLMPIGPGTGVSTKFDVKGDLIVPSVLLEQIKTYAGSVDRLRREIKASQKDKNTVFITRRGNPYSVNSIDKLMQDLRKEAIKNNLNFMGNFKFHQTRATYGTWLMQLMLSVTTVSAAIDFVKRAMLHKNEATTFGYVKFLENTKGKQTVAKAFNELFTEIKNRNWNDFPE